MENILTKRQKEIEAHRAINKHIRTTFMSEVLEGLKQAVNDGNTPIEWFELGDKRLETYIINKFCLSWSELNK